MPPEIAQLLGSLVAILALAWIAGWLKLGGDARITNEAEAARLADEAVSGFRPVAFGIDKSGHAAILRDAAGRVMVLRRHGAQFAARLLDKGASIAHTGDALVVATGDRHFGDVSLNLPDAAQWVRHA